MTTVRGLIELPKGYLPPTARQITIEVRDVSVADAPSVVVASITLRNVALDPDGRIPFAVAVPAPDPSRGYGVRIHVDVDGSGTVSTGDLLSMQSHPVLSRGMPSHVVVPVRRVD